MGHRDAGDAATECDKYTKAIESGELSREDLRRAYMGRSYCWEKRGDYGRAIDDYTKLIEIDPKGARFYYDDRAKAWGKKGDYGRAIDDYTKLIEIDPGLADLYYQDRAKAWYIIGDNDKAIADLTKVIDIREIDKVDLDEAYTDRGLAWDAKGDYDKAIADYTKAMGRYPHADNYFHRGITWRRKGDQDKAISDLTKAIELDPAFVSLAWIMATCPDDRYRDGKLAVVLAEKALRVEETSPILDILAAAYAEAGRFEEAIKTQEKAITRAKQEGRVKSLSKFEASLHEFAVYPQGGVAISLPAFEERLSSYKAGEPWRDKRLDFVSPSYRLK